MKGQIQMFPTVSKKISNKKKLNWENRFQRYSNKMSQDSSTPVGKCAYGLMCDYCDNPGKGRPCVRALNEFAKENEYKIDYDDNNFGKFWND